MSVNQAWREHLSHTLNQLWGIKQRGELTQQRRHLRPVEIAILLLLGEDQHRVSTSLGSSEVVDGPPGAFATEKLLM